MPEATRSSSARSRPGATFARPGPAARPAARAAIASRLAGSRATPFTFRSSPYANATDTPAIPAALFGVIPDATSSRNARSRSGSTLRPAINTSP